ncbi:DUF262 domain-containing protein [Pleionea sp. CnH1-48]|uniref:DUF262 domain-containing protein n=1 Tax=Pleionea sp. CnH1-48 TaxID=2954494 RepID=UPI002096B9BB|nr:DUF262 domain-containing protein [Pleionea sp. CnH1-48]MCO7222708.1 DUF262 domain-containing protein [Pleionea sp. CnH1-48]
MNRKQNFQTIAWFNDIYTRKLLDLTPPYQRRSVWNQEFKDYFVDTLLLNYPAPAIFLYEEINDEGLATYHVVDGKQRLTTIFEFVNNEFPVSDKAQISDFRGKYFSDLERNIKKNVWSYQFSVEYLPTDNEGTINKIFDRINRNTAKLSNQELRHAQYDGAFITSCEEMTSWMARNLPGGFPKISSQSKKQMKDVEFVAHLLLLLDIGPKGHSTQSLDQAFSERDLDWESKTDVEDVFKSTIKHIKSIYEADSDGRFLKSRFKNQADFYSLFGAIAALVNEDKAIDKNLLLRVLTGFAEAIDDESKRTSNEVYEEYYKAARSASNDSGPRTTRIRIIKNMISEG